MKNKLNISTSIILTAVILFFTLLTPAFAKEVPVEDIILSSTENTYSASIYIRNAKGVSGLDFSLLLPKELFSFTDVTIKYSDASDINSENIEKSSFIYNYEKTDNKLTFSGFFTDKSNDDDIHICDISFTDKTTDGRVYTIEFNSTISVGKSSIQSHKVLSLESNTTITESKPDAFLSGDANLDGKVSANDARLILRTSVNLEKLTLSEFPYADTDHNGQITASDARNALRISVGLEENVLHSFIIRSKNGVSCDNGNEYIFFCYLTNISFSAEFGKSEHTFSTTTCYNNKECTVCGKIAEYCTGHKFNDEGCCEHCYITIGEYNTLKLSALSYLQSCIDNDISASFAAEADDYSTYIKYAIKAEHELKKCIDEIKKYKGSYPVYEELELAYAIRYNAFLQCTDTKGNIALTEESFSIISDAVSLSMRYINNIFIALNK